jgi:hypothetical protein
MGRKFLAEFLTSALAVCIKTPLTHENRGYSRESSRFLRPLAPPLLLSPFLK